MKSQTPNHLNKPPRFSATSTTTNATGSSPSPSPTPPVGRGNGHRRSNSRYGSSGNTPNPSSNGKSSNGEEKVALVKLTGIVSKAVGKKVTATVSSGARYQGLLVSADTADNSGLSVALYKPVLVQSSPFNDKSNVDTALPEKMIVKLSDLVDLEILKLDILDSTVPDGSTPRKAQTQTATPASIPVSNATPSYQSQTSTKFKTDTDISRSAFKERELQRWVPDDHDVLMNTSLSLEDDFKSNKNNSGWDQFKVNQDKFGIDSSFDEHLYTTKINKLTPEYQERLARASKIANEIESLLTSDRHILEERGMVVDDSGMDEEDKYSGVDRRGDELMAALRGPLGNSTQNVSGKPDITPQDQQKYNPHEKRAARFHNDPAIVLSSATGGSLKSSTPPSPATVSTAAPGPAQPKALESSSPSAAGTTTTTASSTSALKSKPTSIPPKPPVAQSTEQFRLNSQSEINALREFSANFKIPHKLPNDLLPILSKDQKKQEEIIKKQSDSLQALTKDSKSVKESKPTPGPNGSPTNSLSTTTSTTPLLARKKLENTKSTFNPKAASFTPGNVAKHPLLSPIAQKSTYHRPSNTNPSPRVSNQRPYSSSQGSTGTSGTGSSSKRLHHISAADFFGSQSKVPTKESQEQKLKLFNDLFCFFASTRRRFREEKKEGHVTYDRPYQTPPTWNSTIDMSHDQVYPNPDSIPKQAVGMMIPDSSPFMPNPMLNGPTGMSAAAFGGNYGGLNSKLPLNAHQQQLASMAAFHQLQQQQQFQAAMIYQQQLAAAGGGIPPGQSPMPMYSSTDPFLPPGAPSGFIAPPGNFIGSGSGSPVNNHMILNMGQGGPGGGGNPNIGGGPGYQGGNYGHHGGRRYNNSNNNNAGGNKRSN